MLELTGPNTRRAIRPAVAIRILQQLDKVQAASVTRETGRITLKACDAAPAIENARASYRCRTARKELNAMRADATQALQHQYDQALSIAGPEDEVSEIFNQMQQSLLMAA